MADTPRKFKFTLRFQRRLLAAALQDKQFLDRNVDAVRPEFFTDAPLSNIARCLREHYTKYHMQPAGDVVEERLRGYFRKREGREEDLRESIRTLRRLQRMTLMDLEYLSDQARHFVRIEQWRMALLEGAELIEGAEEDPNVLDGLLPLFHRADTSSVDGDMGVEITDLLKDLKGYFAKESDPANKVPTGYPSLDQRTHGGLGAGEIGVVIGGPGKGKSMMLANMAANALVVGKRVVYVTVELKEPDVVQRVLAKLTDTPQIDVFAVTPEFARRVAPYRTTVGSKYFRVKYFAPAQATPQHIRAYLNRLRVQDGVSPDVLYVDYADELRAVRPYRKSDGSGEIDTYHSMGSIYADLIQIGADFEMPVWTASQQIRAAYDADTVDLSAVSASVKKVEKADVVVTLCQTKSQQAATPPEMDLFFAKVRRGAAWGKVPLRIDFTKAVMAEKAKDQEFDSEGGWGDDDDFGEIGEIGTVDANTKAPEVKATERAAVAAGVPAGG